MAGVQIFSESPISPSTQRDEPLTPNPFPTSEEMDAEEASTAQANRNDVLGLGAIAPETAESAERGQANAPPRSPVVFALNQGNSTIPPAPRSRTVSPRRPLPPPPKLGETLKPSSYYAVLPDPSSQSYAVPRSASGSPIQSSDRPHVQYSSRNNLLSPTSINSPELRTPKSAPLPRKSLDHPPGYVQNPYAADLTPEQRFATQHSPASPTLGYGNNNPGSAGGILGVKSPSASSILALCLVR